MKPKLTCQCLRLSSFSVKIHCDDHHLSGVFCMQVPRQELEVGCTLLDSSGIGVESLDDESPLVFFPLVPGVDRGDDVSLTPEFWIDGLNMTA